MYTYTADLLPYRPTTAVGLTVCTMQGNRTPHSLQTRQGTVQSKHSTYYIAHCITITKQLLLLKTLKVYFTHNLLAMDKFNKIF